jgi:chlorosome envelope protein F
MANENNGVFSDLFNAVGTPIQNVADTIGDGLNSALSIAQSGVNLVGTVATTVVTGSLNTTNQLLQSVSTAISSLTAPKK